jgi:RimJ/RimL family protein N-acetyltransferase
VTTDNSLIQSNWRADLPALTAKLVSLREPTQRDADALLVLLSLDDAPRLGIEGPASLLSVQRLIDRAARDRAAGVGFTYVITLNGTRTVIGLVHIRQLDPLFDSAEWTGVLLPAARGTGAFLDAVRLAGSFAFGVIGARRLEARVSLAHGRGNGALKKLGGVQEGILRRSLSRSGEDDGQYVDQALWSMLKEDWRDHWVSTAPRVH